MASSGLCPHKQGKKKFACIKVVLDRFSDKPRYYNLLLSAWEQRYSGINREAGRLVLESLCRAKHHLKVRIPH